MSVDIDVINSTLTIIGLTITICTRSRFGLTTTGQRVTAAIAVHDAAAFGNFLESVRVARDIVRFAIFADEFGFFLSCQFNRFTVGLFLVVSRNRQSRLCLEDVLVRIFCLIVLIETGVVLRAGVPAGCRLTVEIRTKRVAVWRCRVDFPVAVRIDGFLCLRRIRCIMEGTICTACVDNDRIVCIRRGNQCATALGIIRQSNRAIAIRIGRDQANRIAILDAMDRDIIRRFDGNKAIRCNLAIDRNIFICSRRGNLNLFVCGNLTNIHIALRGNLDVAICKVCSGIRMIIMDINGPKDFDIACRRLDGQVAQACAFAAAQTSCIRHTFRAYGYLAYTAIDGKCRVRQFRLTDKTMNRCRVVTNIIPAILVCPTNGNIRLASSPAVIIRLIIIWQLRNAGWHIAYPVGVHTILVCTRSYTTGDIEDLIFFRTGYPRELTSTYLRGRRIRRCLFTASKVLNDRTRNLPGRCHSRRVFILICNGYEMLTVKILTVRIRLTVILRSSKVSQFPNPSKIIA